MSFAGAAPMPRLSCRILSALFAVSVLVPPHARAQKQPAVPATPWTNTALPLDQRVDSLISRMTFEEKVSQMRDHSPAIPRLGVPKYDWWNEGLHGVAFAGYATNFPQVIGMSATWDTALVHKMAQTISTEARAKYNQAMRDNDHEMFFGLTFWAPNINIFRDPRWGRGQETYGEDPFLTGRMGVAFVSGMQGDDPKYLKVVSTPKHYAVHSGPEPSRHRFNVDVSPHDLEDTYLPAFRATVTEAHAQSVMCAYNAIDGAPACANTMLLKDHLRDAWHFDGYVVSDCAAVADVNTGHHFAPDMAHAAAVSVKAGTDLECGFGKGQAFPALVDAVHQGLISEAEIDTALRRLFTARIDLGKRNAPESYAYGRIPFSEVNSAEHRALSLKAARESMVLLKNEKQTLPLKAGVRTIAVVGPTAELVQALQGNYNGPPPSPVYPLNGIEKQFSSAKVLYAQGSSLVEGFAVPIEHTALRLAKGDGDGLTGEYFNSKDLSGQPVLTRTDRNINFNWDKVVPVDGLQRNNYSVRWTGTFTPPAAGDYKIGARVNYCYACENFEGFNLYLDDKVILDNHGRTGERGEVREVAVHFDDTKPHAIRLEYFHGTGSAGIDLTWEAPAAVLRDEAVKAAKRADAVVAFVGLSPSLEGEEMPVKLPGFSGGDRTSIELPAVQEQLLEALGAAGKPLIVVLQNGSALAVKWAQQHADAVLEAWYPGEEGGMAIAETLAGVNNPAGRLPLTFYAGDDQLPKFEDYSMKGRTYRYFEGKPLYPFGYGLSYSKFSYSGLKLSATKLNAGQSLDVDVEVKNDSARDGDEVAELYLKFPASPDAPVRALRGLHRVHVAAGQMEHIHFSLDARDLSEVNAQGSRMVGSGEYRVSVGGGQPGTGVSVVEAGFSVSGELALAK